MVAPDVSALNRREVAFAEAAGGALAGADGQIKRAKFRVFVPPGVVDPVTGFQQRVVVPEQTRSPQSVGQSASQDRRTSRRFYCCNFFFVFFGLVFFLVFIIFFFGNFIFEKKIFQLVSFTTFICFDIQPSI